VKRKSNISVASAELRSRAETRLRERSGHRSSRDGDPNSAADARRLFHELQVHQVELEMQNAELRKARDEIESALENYTDLYDFAPVGYFTLAASGAINQVNLTGAKLAGIERSRLVGRPFGQLVSAELRPVFNSFLKQVFAGQARQSGDFELLSQKGQPPRTVNIEAQRLLNGQECRAAVMDITERKSAEAATAQLAAIVQSSSDAIIGKSLDSIVTSWNAGAERLFGYSAGEMVGRSISRLIPSDRQDEEARIMSRIRQGESVEHFETVRVAKDGRLLDLSVAVSPIRYATGKIVGASKVARDITGQKLAANKLRVSEIRFRRLFETAHDGVLLLDPGTRKITDANPFMTKMLGYKRSQLVGKELFEIGLLKDEVASREMFQKLTRKHEVRYEDLPLESRGGRHQEVEVVANLYQENGQPVIQCNIRDITERKHAEELLRRNEALFSTLVAQSPVGVYVVDARFNLLQVNPTALPLFKKVRPLIGRNFSEAMHIIWPRPVADQVVGRFRHTLKTGVPYQSPEFAQRRWDTGAEEIYEWQIQRVILPAGEHGVVCFFSDITERKQAEEAQRRMEVLGAANLKLRREIILREKAEATLKKSELHQRHLLEQSHHMQEQLRQLSRQILITQEEERREISRELHDVIAQTLTGINVRLAALAKEAATNTTGLDRNIASTQRLVEKSVEIVHQFARELRPAVLDDLGLIPALHSFVKIFSKRTHILVHLKAFAEVEQLPIAKRTVLFRVAQEALTNVARHAQASRVEVSIQKLPDSVCMKIKDDGKSFQVDRVLDGKGSKRLGLLGMRERLEMIGGHFGVESVQGNGTTVIAQLPNGKAARGGGITDGVR
jgi:PAS domain S-box-containing protein